MQLPWLKSKRRAMELRREALRFAMEQNPHRNEDDLIMVASWYYAWMAYGWKPAPQA